ncbi:MAG: 3-hydroxyisobutyrate dehydrogenase [Chloroflexota bacterium]|mgnify:CR=1 FL=1
MTFERIGFIGLGRMGRPMARHLLRAGYPLVVYDRLPEAMAPLVEAGAEVASGPGPLARACDLVVTMLPGDPEVLEVCTGPEGVLRNLRPGAVLVDMGTNHPETARTLAREAAAVGAHFLDAPVSGGDVGAEQATLTIMVGGDRAVFERVRPFFEVLGRHIFHVGPAGMGQVFKLCNNLISAVQMLATAEAFIVGRKLGADPGLLRQVIMVSSGRCPAVELRPPVAGLLPEAPADRDFAPGFTTELMAKDVGNFLRLAEGAKVPAPVAALARQLYLVAVASGYGPKDFSVVGELFRSWAGL